MANPNPSPETRFKPGVPTNPVGKTSAQRKREIANAERATKLRGRMLLALEKKLDAALAADPDDLDATIATIQSDVLRLLKDTEDRGLGTPKALTEITGANGGPLTMITRRIVDPANEP